MEQKMHYCIRERYPIETAEHVKLAAAYFVKFLERFDVQDRITFATNLEKRANDLNVVIDNQIVSNYAKVANLKANISDFFKKGIEFRKVACHPMKTTVVGVDAIKMLDKIASLATDNFPGLVVLHALLEFDKLANLQSGYDKEIPDPVLTVFGFDPSEERISEHVKVSSLDLRKVACKKVKMEKVASIFGEKFSKSYSDNPVKAFQELKPIDQVLFKGKLL
jgi:hypothetical protein